MIGDHDTSHSTRHTILRSLLVAVAVLACHLTTMGTAVDSLYFIYQKSIKTGKTETANKLFQQLRQTDINDTPIHFNKSDKSAVLDAKVHYWMSEYYFSQGKYEPALTEGNLARELVARIDDTHLKSHVLGNIAKIKYHVGNYDDALKTTLEAYTLDKELNDENLISRDLFALARIYLAVQQPGLGIGPIERAIAIERNHESTDKLAATLGIASELYLLNNEFDKAVATIDEAYSLDHQAGRTVETAIRLVQKAAVLEGLSKLNEAQALIKQALPVLEQAKSTYVLAMAYNQLGSIESQLNNDSQAIAFYKKALEYSIQNGCPLTERAAEHGLWETMRESNPTVALLHLERYTTLNDSILSHSISAQAHAMGANNPNMELAELNEKSQRFDNMVKWGGFFLLLLLLLMVGAIFLAWRRNRAALRIQRQTEESRARFFNNITNELQTPLTVVMNAGQQLLESGKVNADESMHLGNMIVSHGERMLTLVNQLIDIDGVQSDINKPDAIRGDIVMFIGMLVNNFAEIAHQKLITLEFDSPVNSLTVNFIPDHIRKIVHGLIAKAINFTPRSGTVTVQLTPLENDRLRLIVSDTGKGIPQEEQERIFKPFEQSNNGDDGVSTGVTLSLVKQLVLSMNGTINVDSESGKGTTFTIEFPIQTELHHEPGETELNHHIAEKRIRQTRDGSSKHSPLIFIVENNENIAFFIASLLQKKYELRFARDGREALQNAQDLVPDLIITDIVMPVMGGKELISKIRNDSALCHIPIIALTANMSEQERISCFKIGADNVLVKPFSSSELQIIADKLIKQRYTMREQFLKTSNDMTDNTQAKPMSKADMEFINKLVDVIHVQMAKDDIDMEHVAVALSLSRKQLRTRVMAITGMTPVAYVLQVRLNYARRMIAADNTSLTEIASKCGFQNLSHFSKVFKQQFGVSPLQFRKNMDDVPIAKNS
jgi:signal transduction histidine kinase/DNA-binding response OmpR family regulator